MILKENDLVFKKKCFKCQKKLGLMPFNCRCDNLFCSKCRLPEVHNCRFDFKSIAKDQIKKDNPLVNHEKIIKI